MKVIDSKAADGLLVAKAALAATVGRTAVGMLGLDTSMTNRFCRFFRAASAIHG